LQTIGNREQKHRWKAIEINPNGGLVAYHYMGLAYYMLNKFKEAIEAYKKSIEINPNSAMAYHYMGLAYYMKQALYCDEPHHYQDQS
jgi:tetratricopeptide (TPR) repeat protein